MICFETLRELELVLSRVLSEKEQAGELAKRIQEEKEKIEQLRELATESLSGESLRYLQEYRASTIKKQRRKTGKKRIAVQIRYFGEIHQLREDGYSYREIADYLAKYHKLKITAVSIYRYYKEALQTLEEAKND